MCVHRSRSSHRDARQGRVREVKSQKSKKMRYPKQPLLVIDKVEIYRALQPPEVLNNPTSLSGEDVLPGLVLDLQVVFS